MFLNLRDVLCKNQTMKKIDFRILFFLCFFRIPHTKISLLVNFYINLIIFRYFFSGSNMCHNTYKNVYAFFAKSCYFLESYISCNDAQIFIKFFLFVYFNLFYKTFKKNLKNSSIWPYKMTSKYGYIFTFFRDPNFEVIFF